MTRHVFFLPGDELLEWNGHSLVGKTYDEVHDVIADSRHEPQVELRVSRASLTPTGPQVDMGRPMLGPEVCLSRQYSRGGVVQPGLPVGQLTAAARAGNARPAVTISDPLGGTLMLNPNSASSGAAASLGTRIQVGQSFPSFFRRKSTIYDGMVKSYEIIIKHALKRGM